MNPESDDGPWKADRLDHDPQPYEGPDECFGDTPLDPAAEEAVDASMQPRRLHPSSLVFELGSHVRQLAVPAIIALLGAANGNTQWAIIGGILFIPAVIFSLVRFFTYRYLISDGELLISEGLLFRRTRTIPVLKIQNIDLVQNLFHRMAGVAEVRVETASGKESEARMRVLSMQKVDLLRDAVFGLQRALPETGTGASGVSHHAPTAGLAGAEEGDDTTALVGGASQSTAEVATNQGVELLRIPFRSLIWAGLASNRGMLLIGVLIGIYYQGDLSERIDLEWLLTLMPQWDGSVTSALILTGTVVGVFLFLRILGVFWYLLRFFDYRLVRYGEDLRVSCGMFTKVSATVPRNRIQFVSIHRSLVMRWLRMAAIRIETAGGGGGNADNASTMVSRRWFVPVIDETQVEMLVQQLRPESPLNEATLDWRPVAANTYTRLARKAIVLSILVGVAAGLAYQPWGALAGLVVLPLNLAWARRKSRSMRYCRRNDMVVYRSGLLYKKTSVTWFDKVQTARFAQSPFDRRWGHARLSIDTAAAGPAEHVISVPYLDAGFADSEFRQVAQTASRFQPDFG